MKRSLRTGAFLLLGGFGLAQLIQPARVNPPVDAQRNLFSDHRVDPHVAGILRRACVDCHSHETAWPWYSKVSPVSWFVADHVVKGRAKLNFSDWSDAAAPDQLVEIGDAIAKGHMPLPSYLWIHRSSRLSKADRDALLNWADGKLAQASR
jgi:hypothetical protein